MEREDLIGIFFIDLEMSPNYISRLSVHAFHEEERCGAQVLLPTKYAKAVCWGMHIF